MHLFYQSYSSFSSVTLIYRQKYLFPAHIYCLHALNSVSPCFIEQPSIQDNRAFFPGQFSSWTELAKRDTVLIFPIWQTPLCIHLFHNTEALFQLNIYSFLHKLFNVRILIIIKYNSYLKYILKKITASSWFQRLFRDFGTGMNEEEKDSQLCLLMLGASLWDTVLRCNSR